MTHKKVLERFKRILDKIETIQEYEFDYSSYINSWRRCGTTRCVCGYYPIWFKRSWILDNNDLPKLKNKTTDYTEDDLSKFHGLNLSAIRALFYGNYRIQKILNLPIASTEASLGEVKILFKIFYEKVQEEDFYNIVKIK
jgi:hypothetical protein